MTGDGSMGTKGFLAYDQDSLVARPLAELPTLRLAAGAQDVRGWDIHAHDGRRLGNVVDLLVDIDRLRAETLLVSLVGRDHAGALVVVRLDSLSADGTHRRLVPGEGMPPIAVRYQSTTRYSIWVAIAVAVVALAGWMLGFFG
jgi:sporulation protein YlmC with PRC-barrel domain